MKIVFDFGGVLFNWQPSRLLRREIPEVAHDEASAALWVERFFQGYEGDWGEFDRGRLSIDELVPRIAARTGLGLHEVQRVVDGVPHELQPLADTVTLLRRLRDQGRELFFLSNMPEPFAAHLEREHDLVGWFGDGVFSARVGLVKPEAAIFELAARRFGAAPADLLFIDDHLPNVQAATACGWGAIQYTNAAAVATELSRRGLLRRDEA
ncbi:Haloacid dehalogenase [Rubrivivax sp. A210]|uniref:HAD family hydrolase n=1 Tax=Rubrivivax sp. A210 TaxID=2772301 RepID=UPI001918765E|nr:HAD family phosphatase [Rubrivivax sp. A210]CAD5374343.1 Haloacid dehalogenase [Rubrivivax sp. A210]